MSVELHEFRPEEVMAYLDGEIIGERALALADHLEQCTDCSSLADDFCALSQQLVGWKVEPANLEQPSMASMAVSQDDEARVEALAPKISLSSPGTTWRSFLQRPWVWHLASGFAVVLVVSLAFISRQSLLHVKAPSSQTGKPVVTVSTEVAALSPNEPGEHSIFNLPVRKSPGATNGLHMPPGSRARGNSVPVDGADAVDNSVNATRAAAAEEMSKALAEFQRPDKLSEKQPVKGKNSIDFTLRNSQMSRDVPPSIWGVPTPGPNPAAPQMIERTASLSLTVKGLDSARTTLEEIVRQHYGYFAELNTEGQSEAGRTLAASLRVPAVELDATLAELRKLGQPGEEKQGGEEVSAQYVDLKARLDNARHTEKRLTELLAKRAAKLNEVLEVERELAGTREEIERMEAQQRNMEGQVFYASIDLKLREDYKPALNLAPPAAGTRMRNALVDGYHTAVDSALDVLLFVLQAGPSTLFWLLLLFFPARWGWRKLRVVAAQKQSLAGAL
ncbi:MAG TPA: DUF4349 domain-containing protein [Candidatus Saccharimonadales bacterium]|jgi:hypothetical protein|nr:DUF4349 domain-containing protein [Candidatus Saccharimonadales bacterium]